MNLYCVRFFYHPSGHYLDGDLDYKEEYFTISTTSHGAIAKVTEVLKFRRSDGLTHYATDATSKVLPVGITPQQALVVLKAVGLKVVE